MERSTGLTVDAGASGLKALVAILYVMVFIVLFAGVFDRPRVDGGVDGATAAMESADLSHASLGAATPEMGPQGGAAERGGAEDEAAAELIPGDILMGRCRLSLVPSLNPHNGWTHVALYAGKGRLIVAGNPRSGVVEKSIESWAYPEMTWVAYVRVSGADEAVREKAVRFAREKKGQPYDINWLAKQEDGYGWYCSELIWAAYLHASGGNIDLARGPGWFGISPDDIFMHKATEVVGGHFEAKPDTAYSLLLKALAICILAGGGGIFVPHPLFSGRRRRR